MKKWQETMLVGGIGFMPIMLVMLLCSVVGGWLWPYTINEWLVWLGKEPAVVWWQGALLGFCPVVGQATIPVAVATWILMLIL